MSIENPLPKIKEEARRREAERHAAKHLAYKFIGIGPDEEPGPVDADYYLKKALVSDEAAADIGGGCVPDYLNRKQWIALARAAFNGDDAAVGRIVRDAMHRQALAEIAMFQRGSSPF